MSSVFTKIIEGELPGRFVWTDEQCVAFLSIAPLAPGHVLVVPRQEIDSWLDLPADLAQHLMGVSRSVGQAVSSVFGPQRVGLMIQGFEVPHTHLHVWPTNSIADFDVSRANQNPHADALDDVADQLRTALTEAGHGANVPAS